MPLFDVISGLFHHTPASLSTAGIASGSDLSGTVAVNSRGHAPCKHTRTTFTITKTDGSPLRVNVEKARKYALDAINQERKSRGRTPLRLDPALSKIAQCRSESMVNRSYFAHLDPTTGKPASVDLINRSPQAYKWRLVSEGLAENNSIVNVGVDLKNAVNNAIQSLWRDAAYNKTIHKEGSKKWDAVGLGVAFSPEGKMKLTEVYADVTNLQK